MRVAFIFSITKYWLYFKYFSGSVIPERSSSQMMLATQ
jgi:hypothetical protein